MVLRKTERLKLPLLNTNTTLYKKRVCQSESPSLAIFMNREAPISVSFALGQHSCASTMHATVGNWPSGSTVRFTPVLFLKCLILSREIACIMFQVFGMTRPGMEPRPAAHETSNTQLGHERIKKERQIFNRNSSNVRCQVMTVTYIPTLSAYLEAHIFNTLFSLLT